MEKVISSSDLEFLGKKVPFFNDTYNDGYVSAWWEIYEDDLTTPLTISGSVVVESITLNNRGLWTATLSCSNLEWIDPLTDLTHYINKRWTISINALSKGHLGLMNPVDEGTLSLEIWKSRSSSRVFNFGIPRFIGDCYKECRMFPSLALRTHVEFLTGLRTSTNIPIKQFREAFGSTVYEVQYCN